MIIRDATNTDINGIVGLAKEYSYILPFDCSTRAMSPSRVVIVIQEAINVGLAKIAASESGEVVGVALGVVQLNIWSDTAKEIQMLMLFVKEEHRIGTTGGRLYSAFIKAAEKKMKEASDIAVIHVYEQPEGITNINYEKRGFKLLQSQYIKER